MDLKSNMIRVTFRPPEVDPPHPPMNMSKSSMIWEKWGHISKSQEINPVVDESDAEVKSASSSAEGADKLFSSIKFKEIRRVADTTMER